MSLATALDDVRPWRRVLNSPAWRALLGAAVLSTFGDQLARLALAVAVYARSHSPFLTACTYALSYAPYVVSAGAFSGIADRVARVRVMIFCDGLRLALALLVALWQVGPLWWLFAMFTLLALAEPPFEAARAALMPELLDEDAYVAGHSILQTALAVFGAAGFAFGGVLTASVGLRGAMVVDAATFGASALAVALFVPRSHGQLDEAKPNQTGRSVGARSAFGLLRSDRRLRWLLLVASGGAASTVVADGLAVAIAAHDGRGAAAAGVLAAAPLAGAVVVAAVYTARLPAVVRPRVIRPLALIAAGALGVGLLEPGFYLTVAAFAIAGGGTTFQLLANQEYVLAAPAESRGAAFGLASAAVTAASASAMLTAGLAADYIEPIRVVGGLGLAGVVFLVVLGQFEPGQARAAIDLKTFEPESQLGPVQLPSEASPLDSDAELKATLDA